MAVCLPCATKHSNTEKLPQSTKFHRIIGWEGVCSKCKEQTIVYSNQDMNVNPEILKDKSK
jgi:ribosomal protein S27E